MDYEKTWRYISRHCGVACRWFHRRNRTVVVCSGRGSYDFCDDAACGSGEKSVGVNDVHPSEPSGSVAPYLKLPRKKSRKKPGAKPGHKGFRRPPPENITHHVTHEVACCPDCGDKSKDWPTFSKRLKRMLRDAMRLRGKRQTLEKAKYERLCAGIEKRMTQLIETAWKNKDVGLHG